MAGDKGRCGETAKVRIAVIEAHHGEEPPLSGRNGSGAVFFTGCSLKCDYCQNYQISHEGLGYPWTAGEIVETLMTLHQQGIHNVNFVTPDHFFPHTMMVVQGMRDHGVSIPAVFNLSGYQSVQSLRMIESHADIYLPDFKYSDVSLAKRLSRCPDYPSVALDALAEMVRQKGFLDYFCDHQEDQRIEGTNMASPHARKGVLVRHLILPGQVQNSLDALTMLFLEFGRDLHVSLMSQYTPVRHVFDDPVLNRPTTCVEFESVLQYALELGFRHLFFQHPDDLHQVSCPFLPDFSKPHPFASNQGRRNALSTMNVESILDT